MRVAVNMLRPDLVYRRTAFDTGLKNAGYVLKNDGHVPRKGDALLIWNRYSMFHERAKRFEQAGASVFVAEHGYLGKNWNGSDWFALARGHHNGLGFWRDCGPERWASWRVPLAPWRTGGSEIVLLPQRGIGEPGVRMELDWLSKASAAYPRARIRPHPGLDKTPKPLEEDLAKASHVVTWGSGAAIKALLLGIPVLYGLKGWIGAPAAAPIGNEPVKPDRIPMFQRLAWAQWTLDEITTGVPYGLLRCAE